MTWTKAAARIRFASLLLAFSAPSLAADKSPGDQGAVYPLIAHIADITIGRDAVGRLQRKYGPGSPSFGGHAVGARAWVFRQLRMGMYADGFNYDSDGLIADSFNLWFDGDKPNEPNLNDPQVRRLAFMGLVLPGKTQNEVLNRLKKLLPPPKAMHDDCWTGPGRTTLGWHMAGRAVQDDQGQIEPDAWDVTLNFDHDVLCEIDISSG